MSSWLLFAALLSFVLALVFTPVLRDLSLIFGFVDRPNGRKMHTKPIPRVGGIAIALSYGVTFLLMWHNQPPNLTPETLNRVGQLLPGAVIVFAVGAFDDFFGLKPWQKVIGQIAGIFYVFFGAGVQIRLFGDWQLGTAASLVLTVIWVLGCTNAFNLIDGLDGLAAGIGLFATITTLLAALTHGSADLAFMTIPLVGALLGFLRYNFNPASIFLGDCGSLLIGFLLGCFAVIWSQKSATALGMTAPLMVVAIPLLDVALSIVRRFLRQQPIFTADRGHIHHRLLDRGLTPRRVALILYAACGLGAMASLLAGIGDDHMGGMVVILFCIGTWIGVQHLGYAEFGAASRLFGRFRRLVDLDVRLRLFESELSGARTADEFWKTLLRHLDTFGFRRARMKLRGTIRDSAVEPLSDSGLWQIRMQLPDFQYINLFRRSDDARHPNLDAGFVNIVETVFAEKQAVFEAQLHMESIRTTPVPALSKGEATT